MLQITADYQAAGANRHPSAADWDKSGILAFGADRNIALWQPQVGLSVFSHETSNDSGTPALEFGIFISSLILTMYRAPTREASLRFLRAMKMS